MINYDALTEITVKTQDELDMIPLDFKGRICIEFGSTWSPAIVRNRYFYRVVARGNSSVVARGNSSVVAWENSFVEARENSSVVAWKNSFVVASGNSSVDAREDSSVVAYENSSVAVHGNSSVEAWEDSSVVAYGNSSVVTYGNSSVVARGNSSVVAYGNSFVEAWEYSSVSGGGNVQIVDRLFDGRIEITGNARIVYMPKNVEDYCNFYGLKHDKKKGKFFKCVHKQDGRYFSEHDSDFEYVIGEKAFPDAFTENLDVDCGHGVHVAYLAWALDFGRNWGDLAILEVEANLDDVLVPHGQPGKVRCREVTVLREVPLEECGLYGKMLAKRKQTQT